MQTADEIIADDLTRDRRSPMRHCLVSRESLPKSDLIRFVVAPDKRVVADLACDLPGRGLWLSCKQAFLEKAVKDKLFTRAAKQPVIAEASLVAQTAEGLRQRALQSVALARKAGQAISGFDKVQQALASDEVLLLLHADDAGTDGVAKLGKFDVPCLQTFPRDALSQILGQENVVHLAILNGKAGANSLKEIKRFTGFLGETSL